MLINFWFGQLYIGRSSGIGGYRHDAGITFGIGRRGDVPDSELAWRRIWRISWNWLPDRIYKSISGRTAPPDDIAAAKSRFVGGITGSVLISEPAPEPRPYLAPIDSSRWTGRDRSLVGFGAWRREFVFHRSTWRSLMHVYLSGAKERANPSHVLRVAPAAEVGRVMAANDVPSDWKEHDGTPKGFEIKFVHGRASVDERLGEWLIAAGYAYRSRLIRNVTGSMLGALAKTIRGEAHA